MIFKRLVSSSCPTLIGLLLATLSVIACGDAGELDGVGTTAVPLRLKPATQGPQEPSDTSKFTGLREAPKAADDARPHSRLEQTLARRGAYPVQVRFADGLRMRLEGGRPVDLGGQAFETAAGQQVLALLEDGAWVRTFSAPPERLEALSARLRPPAGQQAPDLNRYFTYYPPADLPLLDLLDLLESLPEVESANPKPHYKLAAPDYSFVNPDNPALPYQQYLQRVQDGGMGVTTAWIYPGGRGEGIDFFDVENGYDPQHPELTDIWKLHPSDDPTVAFPWAGQSSIDHGTAVLGVVAGVADESGVTGIAHEARSHMLAVSAPENLPPIVQEFCNQNGLGACLDLEDGLVNPLLAQELSAGDVLLIELQVRGPNWTGNGQKAYVPVEWEAPVFDAIQLLTWSGVVVVEAAGNGEEDLDDDVYLTETPGHTPFRVVNGVRVQDSGAIMVGAVSTGYEWLDEAPAGAAMWFSNHGARVDVSSFGEGIVTSGYGDLEPDEWPEKSPYTSLFGGTSGASALVAGAATSLQGIYINDSLLPAGSAPVDAYLWSPTMRRLLREYGVPQLIDQNVDQAYLSQYANINPDVDANVGPRVNLERSVNAIVGLSLSCSGDEIAAPRLSMPDQATLQQQDDTGWAYFGIEFAEVPIGQGDNVVIAYTLDGSPPDCLPNIDSSCDANRVRLITRAGNWRFDSTPAIDPQQYGTTVKVRAQQYIAMGECVGAVGNHGPEVSATYTLE
ncbi:MAG: S8 family serine peptidase [Gammaproteobacteria bacterium]|nr:S8 family serine peptidase [Gammaproteobacteria bacterium]